MSYDKRNQRFEPSDGFISKFTQEIPFTYNESQTIVNGYEITNYHEYVDNNVLKLSFYSRAANSLGDDDVRISQDYMLLRIDLEVLRDLKLDLQMEVILLVVITLQQLIYQLNYLCLSL